MPIYSRGKDVWRVVIVESGDRKDYVIRGTRKDAVAFEARTRAALEVSGTKIAPSRVAPTFLDFCVDTYRKHAETALRESTWKIRQYHVATLVGHLGDRRLTEIDNAVLESFKLARHSDSRSPRTINAELASLQAILSYARRVGVPCADPQFVWLRAVKSKRAKPWSRMELERLFRTAQAEAPFLVPLLIFLVNTGCRKTEALHVTWEHIDFERGLIRIWPSDEWRPKDDEPREIPMSDTLRDMLHSLERRSSFVFPSSAGGRYASWPKNTFDRVRKIAGLTGGPHTLRHTFASHFLAAKPDVFLLARILGHGDTAVTRIYSHLLPGHLYTARNAVNFAPAATAPSALATSTWTGPRRGGGGRWATRPVAPFVEEELPLPVEAPAREVEEGVRLVDATIPEPARQRARKTKLRPELAEVRRRFAEADADEHAASGRGLGKDGLREVSDTAGKRTVSLAGLPDSLPANDFGTLACARVPKNLPSSRLVAGMDVLGIEPRTSRVRF